MKRPDGAIHLLEQFDSTSGVGEAVIEVTDYIEHLEHLIEQYKIIVKEALAALNDR